MASNHLITPTRSSKTEGEEDALDSAELAKREKDKHSKPHSSTRRKNRKFKAERAQFSLLATELPETEEQVRKEKRKNGRDDAASTTSSEDRLSRTLSLFGTFWYRVSVHPPGINADDPCFDFSEEVQNDVVQRYGKEVKLSTLKECHNALETEQVQEIQAYRQKSLHFGRRLADTVLGIFAALYIYVLTVVGIESALVVVNSALATAFFCFYASDHAVKLDFSFLAFSVVFPLTFLLQSNFSHRDKAVKTVADFNGTVLNTALNTLTVDFPDKNGNPVGGRLSLPENFNAQVIKDCRELIQLVYEYLSMPPVGFARYIAFSIKNKVSKRVHALQNDIIKRIRRTLFDFSMHTEEMRKYGLASAEASRLNGFHSTLELGFEDLRVLKAYRTPQATRSFGRVYLLILPWLSGPYFAWIFESTSYAYAITLSCMTFLIVYGLLTTQHSLEDPFVSDARSWAPRIDNVKLDYEMSLVLQGLEQYYANAELRRTYELAKKS